MSRKKRNTQRSLINGDADTPNMSYPLVTSDSFAAADYLTGTRRNGANPDSVLGIPAYWCGISKISNRIGNLPIDLWKETPSKKRIATTHPLREFAVGYWDGWLPAEEAIKTITLNALRFGNGFGLIHRGRYAEVTKISIIEPSRVAIYRTYFDDGSMVPSYKVNNNGTIKDVDFEDMIHIRGLSGDGCVGYSVVEKLNTALALNLKIYRYSETYFENSAVPKVVVTYPAGKQMTEKQVEDAKQLWSKTYQGDRRAHGTAFLNNGATVTELSDTSQEAQLLESKQFSLVDIANILNCPVSRLNGQQVTSYSSLESDNKAFLEDCLDTWLCQWEHELRKLLTEEEKAARQLRFVFDRSELDTPDLKTLTDCVTAWRINGIVDTNEAREKLGYDPVDDDDQNLIMINSNMVVLGEEPPEPPTPPAAPVDPQAAPTDEPTETPGDEPTEPEENARSIAKASVDRLMTRLVKSAHKAKNDDWFDGHMSVFRSALPSHSEHIDSFFNDLREELKATSTDTHKQVIEFRAQNNKLIEVCNA